MGEDNKWGEQKKTKKTGFVYTYEQQQYRTQYE